MEEQPVETVSTEVVETTGGDDKAKRLQAVYSMLDSDEAYRPYVPPTYNEFLDKVFKDEKYARAIHKMVASDEVYSTYLPETFEETVQYFGLGKPSVNPQSASGLASQQQSGLTPQAQSVPPTPSQPSEVQQTSTSGQPDFGFKGIVERVGKETPTSKANEVIASLNKGQKEDTSLGEDLVNSFLRGSAQLGQSLAETPAFIYDIAAMPQNYIADKFDIPALKASSEETGKMLGIENNAVADYYRKQVEASQSKFQEKYDKGITDYFSKGDYSKGFGLLANQIAESAPVTISLMMGNAAGVGTAGSISGSGLVFGADKKAQLDRDAPWMSEQEKATAAMMYGLSEGLFEQFGLTKIGGVVSNVLKQSGKEEAKRIAKEGFKESYGKILRQYFGTMTEEALSEAATQYSQNAIAKYSGEKPDQDLTEGVADAFIVGLGASSIYGTAPTIAQVAKTKKGIEEQKKIQEEKAQITQSIESPELPDAVKGTLAQKLKELNEKEANIVIADSEVYNELSDAQKKQVDVLQSDAEQITQALSDPNLTPDAKVVLEEKVAQIEDEKDAILEKKEIQPSKVETPTEATTIKEQSETLPPEIESLNDNEVVTIKYETLDEIPESLRDKANKFGGQKIELRKTILGIPIGKKSTSKTKEGYSVTAYGSDIKEAARQTLKSNNNQPNTTSNDERQSNNQQEVGGSAASTGESQVGNDKGNSTQENEVTKGAEQAPASTEKQKDADLITRRRKELESLTFDDNSNLLLNAAKEKGEDRYDRQLKTEADKSQEGRKILDKHKAEDILSNEKSSIAERVTARAHLEFDSPMTAAHVSDVEKSINTELSTVGNGEGQAYWSDSLRRLKKIYDSEIQNTKAQSIPTTNESTKIESVQQAEPNQEGVESGVGNSTQRESQDSAGQQEGKDKGKVPARIPTVIYHIKKPTAESENIVAEMDAVFEKKGQNFKAQKSKFESKYGDKAKQAVDINRNFEKYKDQLMDAGIIKKIEC